MSELINEKKAKIQNIALNHIEASGHKCTVILSPGTGKSKLALDAVKKKEAKRVLITYPRTPLYNNWLDEISKWGFTKVGGEETNLYRYLKEDSTLLVGFVLTSVQDAYKWSPEKLNSFDYYICDEIHTTVTEEYGLILGVMHSLQKSILGLTGTPDIKRYYKKYIKYKLFAPIVFNYQDSAKDGIINKRKYYILNLKLNNNFKVEAGTKKKKWMSGELKQYEYWENQFLKGIQAMRELGSIDLFKDAAYWLWEGNGDADQKKAARIFLNAMSKRRHLLNNLSSSAFYAKIIKEEILKTITDSKVLVFSNSIKQIEKITKHSVHSELSSKEKDKKIKDFNTNEIRELGNVETLTLGMNLEQANYLIMEGLNSSDTGFKQKAGRGDRLDPKDFAHVIFINYPGTQREKWLSKAIEDVEDEIIYTNSLEELMDLIKG